jgi:hypothetical protein
MSKEPFAYDREARTKRKQTRPPRARNRRYVMSKPDSGEPQQTLERQYQPTLAECEQRQFVAQLAESYVGVLKFYKSPYSGEKPHDLAVEEAEAFHRNTLEWLRSQPEGLIPSRIGWRHLSAIAEEDMQKALATWAAVCEQADDHLASGNRAAEVAGAREPYELAQFMAIRAAFADEWQPRGGIESALIDMLVVAFSLQMYWTAIAHARSTEIMASEREATRGRDARGWRTPHHSVADAIEQAYRHADGYNRQFLRVLRQMRDLRRYAPPVIVNNGGQVNVGQQQVNVNA